MATNQSQGQGIRSLKDILPQPITIDKLEDQYITIRDFEEQPNTKFGPQGGTYLRITAEVKITGSNTTYKTYTFNTRSAQIRQTLMNAQNNLPVQLKVCRVVSGSGYYWILQP